MRSLDMKTFQRCKQLLMALQVIFSKTGNEEDNLPFCRRSHQKKQQPILYPGLACKRANGVSNLPCKEDQQIAEEP
ncbi:hypothetical protein GH733_013305, partial [Mirounga leonina]